MTEPAQTTCTICGAPAPEGAGATAHGVRLCSPCANGDNDQRLGELGFSFQRVTTHRNRGGSVFAAHVSRETRLDLQVKFRREGFTSRLLSKLGGGDMEIGVAEFDDAVLIEVEEFQKATVELLLQDPAVRSAILSMLAQTSNSVVEIVNGMVSGAQHGNNATWPILEDWIRDALVIQHRIIQREDELISAW